MASGTRRRPAAPDDISLSTANIIKWVVENDTLPAADAIGNGTNATNVPWTIRRPAFDTSTRGALAWSRFRSCVFFNVMCFVRSLPLFLAALGGIFFLTIWFALVFLSKHGWVYWEGDYYFYWPSIWYSFIVFASLPRLYGALLRKSLVQMRRKPPVVVATSTSS